MSATASLNVSQVLDWVMRRRPMILRDQRMVWLDRLSPDGKKALVFEDDPVITNKRQIGCICIKVREIEMIV
jgi:hypothetical protein